MYNPLLCCPLLHYWWGRCCPFYLRLAARSSTVIPPLHCCWGKCCPFFFYGWRRDPLLCYTPLHYWWSRCYPCFFKGWLRDPLVYCANPPTILLGQMLPVFYTVGGAILYCATPPYIAVGADAARFFCGWLRDPLLCYPPLHYRWGRLCATFTVLPPPPTLLLGDPSLCYPLHYT